jgi:hypothetical protein
MGLDTGTANSTRMGPEMVNEVIVQVITVTDEVEIIVQGDIDWSLGVSFLHLPLTSLFL